VRKNGKCVCLEYQTLVENVCVCNPGFVHVKDSFECQCPLHEHVSKNDTCECNDGFVRTHGVCECPIHEELLVDKCVCKPGFIRVNGTCVCPEYEQVSLVKQSI
jgi:hypothetical protein